MHACLNDIISSCRMEKGEGGIAFFLLMSICCIDFIMHYFAKMG